MKIYLNDNPSFERDYDYSLWVVAADSWVISGHNDNKHTFFWDVKTEEMLEPFRRGIFKDKSVIFVMHPCYFNR